MGMPPEVDPRVWLQQAQRDQRAAMACLAEPYCLPANALWNLHQACEKAIKAVLLQRGIRFPFVHDLPRLLLLVPMHERPIDLVEDLALISAEAMQRRYPSDLEEFPLQDLARVQTCTERILAWSQVQVGSAGEAESGLD